jgi:hypothetical protein
MRCTTIMFFSLALLCAACVEEGGEENGADAEESGETGYSPPAECEDRATQADCEGLGGAGWRCAWVDVYTDRLVCEDFNPEPRCLTLTYQGAGCLEAHACGAAEGPNVYVRDAGEAGIEVFQVYTCEDQPDPEWIQCQWTDMGITPYEECACFC